MLPPLPSVYQPSAIAKESRSSTDCAWASRSKATSDALQAHLHEQPEELPVVARRLATFDAAEPFHDVVALAAGERLPQVFGHEREREPDGSHLHHALIDVVGARPPVLAALGIGAVREPLDPPVPVVERPAARDQRHDAPERAAVPLELRDAGGEVRAERAEPGPGATGGEVGDDRLDEIDHCPLHVGFRGERVAGHRVGPRVLQRVHHAIRSSSSARTSCSSASPPTKRPISATARSPMRASSVPSEPAM